MGTVSLVVFPISRLLDDPPELVAEFIDRTSSAYQQYLTRQNDSPLERGTHVMSINHPRHLPVPINVILPSRSRVRLVPFREINLNFRQSYWVIVRHSTLIDFSGWF